MSVKKEIDVCTLRRPERGSACVCVHIKFIRFILVVVLLCVLSPAPWYRTPGLSLSKKYVHPPILGGNKELHLNSLHLVQIVWFQGVATVFLTVRHLEFD